MVRARAGTLPETASGCMCCHQTPTEDLQAFQCGVMAQEFQLLSPVFVRKENRLAIIPTRGDVKCGVSLDEPGFACHTTLAAGIIGQNARSNFPLPEMACAFPAGVEVQRVTPVGTAQSDCQRVPLLRDGQDVYLVIHQAISQIRTDGAFAFPATRLARRDRSTATNTTRGPDWSTCMAARSEASIVRHYGYVRRSGCVKTRAGGQHRAR